MYKHYWAQVQLSHRVNPTEFKLFKLFAAGTTKVEHF